MKKLYIALFIIALACMVSACDTDYATADTGLNGNWIALNNAQLQLSGMNFTRISALGAVETGTFSAADGTITFNRHGYTPTIESYYFEFPRLEIGAVTYYHDSPSVPLDISGVWYSYPYQGNAVIFGEGKRKTNREDKGTYVVEGDYELYLEQKGTYTVSSRNLPGQDQLITTPTHVNGVIVFSFVNIMMPINLLVLFDLDVLTPPETHEDVEQWWFSLAEVRKYFEDSADRADDLETKSQIYYYMDYFFGQYSQSVYDYSIEYDEDLLYRYAEHAAGANGELNKLTLRITYEGGTYGVYTYLLWNGTSGL